MIFAGRFCLELYHGLLAQAEQFIASFDFDPCPNFDGKLQPQALLPLHLLCLFTRLDSLGPCFLFAKRVQGKES